MSKQLGEKWLLKQSLTTINNTLSNTYKLLQGKIILMQEILNYLERIEKKLDIIDSKIDNFLGFEELSEEELKELDEIEAEMEKGEKYPLE